MKIEFLFLFCIISICGYAQKIKSIETDNVTIFYDTLGNPMRTLETSGKKISAYQYKNAYDGNKHLLSRTTFLDTVEVAYYGNQYSGKHLIRSDFKERTNHGLSQRHVLYTYNEIDSLQRKMLFNGVDTIKIISFSYNNDKKISKEIEENIEYKSLVEKQISYNPLYTTFKEFKINSGTRDTIAVSEKKVYKNNRGDVIKIEDWKTQKTLFDIRGKEIDLSDEEFRGNRKGYLTIYTIDYVYDRFGNWIKIKRYAKGKLIGIESRIINYY